MGDDRAEAFERCMAVGGVALFGADTVYGLACDVHNRVAVERLYRIKRRAPGKPAAVMFFDRELALDTLPELGDRVRGALARLLPGGVTVLLDNPQRRFPLACGEDLTTFGLRVVEVDGLERVRWPVLQSSANLAGGADARRLEDVSDHVRRAVDLVLDAGELPGTPSTVVDLRRYEEAGEWRIVRQGAVSHAEVAAALDGGFTFEPEGYDEMIRADIPAYEQLQERLVAVTGDDPRRVLELGTGTGETARRLLARHPQARLVGVDESAAMLAAAARSLPPDRVSLVARRIQDELPAGPFDLVVSALCVHHLEDARKRDLFAAVAGVLAPRGRLVLADVVVPTAGPAVIELTPGFDRPSTVADQLGWLDQVGFDAAVAWEQADLAVIVADLRG